MGGGSPSCGGCPIRVLIRESARIIDTSKEEQMMPNRPLVALIYDFDGTLARGNIQESSFIPDLKIDKDTFWTEVEARTKKNDCDQILVYMQLMLQKAGEQQFDLTRDVLRKHGENSQLFEGLCDKSWFKRVNEFASAHNLCLKHYVISSGTQEMIEGSVIADEFAKIFASRYLYDDAGKAVWPGVAINYTNKTQFLFRINKGIENVWDQKSLNEYMPEQERQIPFSRMIFIGDGQTDVPAMKTTTYQGGYSIATYDPKRDPESLQNIHKLIADERANYVAPADYTKDSPMDILVRGILGRIARTVGPQST